MKGSAIKYSEDELRWIEAHKSQVRRISHAEFVKIFDRQDVALANYVALCKRRGWMTGRNGRFHRGQKSWNKGKKIGLHPGSAATAFKKGNMSGAAAKKYKPVGTERVTADGYIERKLHDGLPPQSRWQTVHRINWEAVNGPVPDGHVLKCLDGDKSNTDPSNWECIQRALLPRLNARWRGVKFDDAAPEVKPAVMAVAKLDQAVREASKSGSET
jgi:hypothetical protein